MLVKELLQKLHLGSSVAEHDEALERYFVETATFRELVRGDKDIIAGDKGTGKTALYRILEKRYPAMEDLGDVEVVAAFNPAGNPVFQRLAEGEPLEEGQYVGIWKAYFVALAGNWILELNEGAFSHRMEELDALLTKTGLRSRDDAPQTVFSQLVNLVKRVARPTSAEIAVTWTPEGMPVVAPRAEFEGESPPEEMVEHDQALGLVNDVLEETGLSLWLVLDRLDEAFQGFPAAEVPALRALLRTYLDLLPYEHMRLKLFVRRDLFGRIIEGGFVNLTHVNARKVEIIWDDEDLFDLLCRRLEDNTELMADLGLEGRPREQAFATVFPEQVDLGERKPTTWNWILSRISDGNGIKPPRNLIDLVSKAQDAQARREAREEREHSEDDPLIGSDALKRGLTALSAERAEDTLLAEAGDHAAVIEQFRGGKAEHNELSLADALGCDLDEVRDRIKPLLALGFLEPAGESFKIPMLYRDGLDVTQGKAFDTAE